MKSEKNYNLGVMFRREYPPEALPEFARKAEKAGFDELWIVEDCFYASGIVPVSTALACTESISVGLGIMPAVARNPVFTAMEIATLARMYPGRFLPGIGHGVADWMRQIGALPKSQLRALEEVTVTVRKLLAGQEVNFKGQYVQLERAKLIYPPLDVPPISLGVIGPKSLQLSGRVADGTILSEYSNPAYVAWAKEQIQSGINAGSSDRFHRLTLFSFAYASPSTAHARMKLRPMVAAAIASGDIDPKLAPMGILPQAREYREAGGQPALEDQMPDAWIDQLAIVGTAVDWKLAIENLVEKGVQTIVLVPLPDTSPDEIDTYSLRLGELKSI